MLFDVRELLPLGREINGQLCCCRFVIRQSFRKLFLLRLQPSNFRFQIRFLSRQFAGTGLGRFFLGDGCTSFLKRCLQGCRRFGRGLPSQLQFLLGLRFVSEQAISLRLGLIQLRLRLLKRLFVLGDVPLQILKLALTVHLPHIPGTLLPIQG